MRSLDMACNGDVIIAPEFAQALLQESEAVVLTNTSILVSAN